MSKPRAVPENLVCSECDQPWEDHPKNPRRRDCIELLKDARIIKYVPGPYWNQWSYTNPITITKPEYDGTYWYSNTTQAQSTFNVSNTTPMLVEDNDGSDLIAG